MRSVGEEAPDFELENHHRQKVSLSSFRNRKHVVLAFHPLAWTPVCANEISELQKQVPALDKNEAHVLGISVDSSATKAAWAKSLGGVSFDLLCDFYPHGAVAEQYGVLLPWGAASRAIFVVDKTGRIVYAREYDIPESPDIAEVLACVASLPHS
jgi:peroxiredoxin